MIQDEFSRLIFMYQEASQGKMISVEDIFKRTLDFIEHLKEVLVTGDEEDKQAAVRMISELYNCMQELTQTLSRRSGMSEEQLLATAENRANYTPEQWKNIQESKQRMASAGQGLAELLKPEEEASTKPETPATLMSKSRPAKKGFKGKRAKKSDWMRS